MNVSEFERKGIRLSLTKEGTLKYSAPKCLKGEFLEQLRQNNVRVDKGIKRKSDGCDG